jgi:FkbM family methyltransferase
MECPRYYSQHGQDRFVANELFKNKRGGFFIEIGAYDGISLSNSYYFEKHLDWKGICVEPVAEIFEKLIHNRNCTCINSSIAENDGIEDFYYITGNHPMGTKYCSGLVKHYPENFLKIIEKEIQECGGAKQLKKMPCMTPGTIFKKHEIEHIDYLSIDVEGAEMSILTSIDFEKVKINAISVENLHFGEAVKNYLENAGFKFIKKIGYDEIYRRKQ